jgi:hypothetical protein
MNSSPIVRTVVLFAAMAAQSSAASSTGTPFFGDPPDETHAWAVHDRNRPQPPRVEPGTFSTAAQPGRPPSDAVVLFDGSPESLARWQSDTAERGPVKWAIKDGALEVVPKTGGIRSLAEFGDCQLHLEWAAPRQVQGSSQGRGNSGIFLMGLFEVQILDNYDNATYADGFAGALYGVNPPLANALHPPGEFQSIDIVFRRPVSKDGKVIDPGYVTVFCNGVLLQDHTTLEGPTGHIKRTANAVVPERGPLKLQDHSNPVRFRNIWYRPLPPRTVEGGTDGILTAEAAKAKRAETARTLRADAATLAGDPTAQMLRLGESLVYEHDRATFTQFEQMAQRYTASVKALSGGELETRKNEIRNVTRAFQYLVKFGIAPSSFTPVAALEGVAKAQGWDQEKK